MPTRRRSRFALGLLLLAAAAGLGLYLYRKPFSPGPAAPGRQVQTAPAPTATPGPAPPDEQLAQEPPRILADVKVVASGQLSIPFLSYDVVANGLFALVNEGGGQVDVTLVEWAENTFEPTHVVTYPAGRLMDVTFGDLYNEGYGNALVTTDKGFLFVQDDGRSEFKPQSGILAAYVGDWDGDDRKEAVYFQQAGSETRGTVYRLARGGRSDRVGSFKAENLPRWIAATNLTVENRQLLLGASPAGPEVADIGLYRLDPEKGLEKLYGGRIPNQAAEPLISSTAGLLGEKAAFAVSYRADPSYLEIFDITDAGIAVRGRILLPTNDAYYVMAGHFTDSRTELLAITRSGRWTLYGF